MSLEQALDALIGSEAFERLLLERARPLVARADAGEDALVAALARSLGAPVLLVAPGPREAERLARGAQAWLGEDGAALLPSWEALPVRGDQPLAGGLGAQGRGGAPAPGRQGRVRPGRSRARRDAGPRPHPRRDPAGRARQGDRAPAGRAGRAAGRARLRAHGRGRAPRRVRGARRRARRVPRDLAAPRAARVLGRRDRVAPRVRAVLAAVDRAARPRRGRRRCASWSPTTRWPNAPRARAPRHLDRFRDGLERLAEGLHAEGFESLAPLLFDRMPVPAELLPEGSWVVVSEARRTFDRARRTFDDAEALAEASNWPGPRAVHDLDEALEGRVQLRLSGFTEGIDTGLEGWGSAQGNPAELARRASELAERGYRVLLTARGHGSLERVREFVALPGAESIEAELQAGFVFPAGKLAVATEEDLFGSRRHTRDAPRFTSRRSDAIAEELEVGDFAVHRVHGVARYVGVQRREIAGSERDYMVLEYASGDRLSVPTDQVGMVAKYVGGETPRLSRLGTSDWARTTGRVKRAVKDMAGELVRLYSVRMSIERPPYGPDTPWQMELEDAFPHEETGDQVTAIEEVKADLLRPRPMDRLICGDVGFGKTEIAVRAAFKVVMEGKQVAVLVPTTLLAEQHLITFGERYAPFPVKVAMLSRFVSKAGAGARRRGPAPRRDRRRDRDAPPALGRHRVQGPGARRGRRGAAVRRGAQGTAEEAPRAGRRPHDVGDADPADARDGAGRHPRHVDRRHAAGGPAAGPHVRRPVRRGARPRRRSARAAARGAGLLGPQPRRDDRAPGRVVAGTGPRRADRGGARADGRGHARTAHDPVLGPRGRHPDVDRDHRVRSGRPERQHARRRRREPARALADVPAARARRTQPRAGVRVLLLPAATRADRGGARAAHDDRAAPGARQRVPDRAPRPGDPRRGQRPRRRTARPHRGGRVRHVRAAAPGVGRRDEGRAARRRRRRSGSICR